MCRRTLLSGLVFFALLLECRPIFSEAESRNLDDVLLVVHYNHAYFRTSDFLESLYASFPHIVFYGDEPNPALLNAATPYLNKVILIPTRDGYFFSRVVSDALERSRLSRIYIHARRHHDEYLEFFQAQPR